MTDVTTLAQEVASLLIENKQLTARLAEAEAEMDELRRAVWEQPSEEECDSTHADTLDEIHRCNRAAVQLATLTARLADAEARNDELEASVNILQSRNASLTARLAEAEARYETLAKSMSCYRCADMRTRLAAVEALLTTACDAWECGQMVTGRDGIVLADYKAACLPRAWYEAAKGGE